MANPEAEGAGRTPRKKPQDGEGTPGKSYKVERVVILFRINQERGHRRDGLRGSARQQCQVGRSRHKFGNNKGAAGITMAGHGVANASVANASSDKLEQWITDEALANK